MIIDNWLLLLASPAQCHAGNFHQTFIRKKKLRPKKKKKNWKKIRHESKI